MRQAVILAGGKGTRLRSVLGDLPKPLADVGGEPLLAHQLKLLRRHGIRDVVLLVNHGAGAIAEWLGGAPDYGLNLRLIDDGEARGTAGAVLAAWSNLAPEFAVLYADTMLDVDLTRFWEWHAHAPEVAASILLHPNDHPADSDLVEIGPGDRILRFHPYPHPPGAWLPNLVNAALYIVRRDSLIPWRELPQPVDFGKQLFPEMLREGLVLRGYNSTEYIKDAGTPGRLERVRQAFMRGAVDRASLRHRQRAVFIDRDGTLNKPAGHLRRAEGLQVFPFVGPALRRLNDAEWRSVVITNQPVLARGEATEADMRRIHARLDSEVARDNAYFDRLYLCPHHPDRGFPGEIAAWKLDCDCRKPQPGLLLTAARELNIDLAESWFIGDSTADLGTAENVGVSSILVRTGSAGLDDVHPFEPGFSQADFGAAVDFILDDYPRIAGLCAPFLETLQPGADVFVGGLARAGKSTVAATLARELRRGGQKATIVHLDRWIRSAGDRTPGILGRYDIEAIRNVVARAASRSGQKVELALPFYSRRRKLQMGSSANLVLDADTIVFWEGVIAIEVARQLGRMDATIFVDAVENGRKSRFHAYDRDRGTSAEQSRLEWDLRETDEHPAIREHASSARHSISLDPVLS